MNKTQTLWVFNPETDFALASGNVSYTPPKRIISLRRHLALIPAIYALEGDSILLLDKISIDELHSLPYYNLVREKRLRIVDTPPEDTTVISPWGWNLPIRNHLLSLGAPYSSLPSDSRLSDLRDLSHRRNTIIANKILGDSLGIDVPLPVEFSTTDDALHFMNENPGCYIKSPWSSSGRGIIIAGMLNAQLSREWLNGAMRRQRSVIAETPCLRTIDFATEWELSDGNADFCGFSIFDTTPGGAYRNNIISSQDSLRDIISRKIPVDTDLLVSSHKQMLESVIGHKYDGPVGIDCCSGENDDFRPCLEINMRRTMGHVSLSIHKDFNVECFIPGQDLISNSNDGYLYNRER